jgi:hypothetical protein
MRKHIGKFYLGLFCLALVGLIPLFGQGPSGFTKIASNVQGLTYTDTTCADGTACTYAITSLNAAGESTTFSPEAVAVVPSTGTHTVTITWNAAVADATHSAATGYNVYQGIVTKPNAPTSCNATTN